MSLGDRLGIAGLIVALIALATPYLWPEKKWIGWFCISIAAVLLVGWATLEIREKFGDSMASLLLSILIGAICGGGAASLIWQSARTPAKEVPAPDTIQLSLTCDTVNLPMPYRGDMWFLETIFLKGLAKTSPNPLKPDWFWPEKDVFGTGFRCVLKNHGTTPAFGVTIPLEAVKKNVIRSKENESWSTGDVIEKYNPTIIVPQPLGQQGQEPFTFYICSYSPDNVIEIKLPTFAFVNGDDVSKKSRVALRVTATRGNPLPIMPTRRTSR